MKILLITLPREGEYRSWITPGIAEPKDIRHLPLGLLSLATNIDQEDVTILDPFSEYWTIQETLDKIHTIKPDVLGISAVSRRAYALHEILRLADVPWKVVGGPHATYHSREIKAAGADAVFIGQLADIEFKHWLNAKEPGIFYCKTDINQIHFPNRQLMDYKHYLYAGEKIFFKADNRMQMFSSVGCANRCSFCSVQSKLVQRKTAGKVVEEMNYLKALGSNSIHVMDDNFNTSNQHVRRVLEEMNRANWHGEWSLRGQVKFDLSLVPALAKSGLKRIHVGIEALDDKILDWYGKNHTVKDIENFCQVMKDNGVDVLAYFIIGAPNETDEYILNLPDRIWNLGIRQPYINVLYPQPDTAYYDDLVRIGVYGQDIWREYFKNPTPDFEIPAPFGDVHKDYLMHMAETIIKRFI